MLLFDNPAVKCHLVRTCDSNFSCTVLKSFCFTSYLMVFRSSCLCMMWETNLFNSIWASWIPKQIWSYHDGEELFGPSKAPLMGLWRRILVIENSVLSYVLCTVHFQVSNGAECVLIKKSWFLQHATEATLRKLRNQVISLQFVSWSSLTVASACFVISVLTTLKPCNNAVWVWAWVEIYFSLFFVR